MSQALGWSYVTRNRRIDFTRSRHGTSRWTCAVASPGRFGSVLSGRSFSGFWGFWWLPKGWLVFGNLSWGCYRSTPPSCSFFQWKSPIGFCRFMLLGRPAKALTFTEFHCESTVAPRFLGNFTLRHLTKETVGWERDFFNPDPKTP